MKSADRAGTYWSRDRVKQPLGSGFDDLPAESRTVNAAVRALEARWSDRFGRLPEPVVHLLAIARIKALAADKAVSAVEIQGPRLMLQRNGEYILLEGRRFPRLRAIKPAAKLAEAEQMLLSL